METQPSTTQTATPTQTAPSTQTATTTSPDISVETLQAKTEDEIGDNEVEDLGSMSSPEVDHPPLPFHHQELLHGNCLFKEENVKEVKTSGRVSACRYRQKQKSH